MLGSPPSEEETEALLVYLKTLESPPNPFRTAIGELTEAAARGKVIFESTRAGCADCHDGPHFTDGLVHDVGLGSESDVYDGYNTPSLIGIHQKVRWLHSGRAKSLNRVVAELHSPEKVSGGEKLTEDETADLIEYLRSL